jgi:hypothetical protein
MFPGIPHQSGYNKRLRAAGPVIAAAITALARDTPSWHEVLRLVDSTPVPCGMSRFFWGLRLYLISTPDGMPVIWGLADMKMAVTLSSRLDDLVGHRHGVGFIRPVGGVRVVTW